MLEKGTERAGLRFLVVPGAGGAADLAFYRVLYLDIRSMLILQAGYPFSEMLKTGVLQTSGLLDFGILAHT